MAAIPGDVPVWLQDDHSEADGGEDIALDVNSNRQYTDYTLPPRRSWCRRCAPVLVCLALSGVAAGLAVHFTGKSAKQLAEGADEWVEDNVPVFGGGEKDEGDEGGSVEKEEYSDEPTDFVFYSEEFENDGEYPLKFTAEGEGESPPLIWKNVPEGTKSMVLFFDEPGESGEETTTYWVAYDIPVAAIGLHEGLPNVERVELEREDSDEGNGGNDIFMQQGINTWGSQSIEDGEDVDFDDIDPPIGSFGYRPPDVDDGDEKSEVRFLYFRLLALKERLDGSLEPVFATPEEVKKEAYEVGIVAELNLRVSLKEN
eukprot:CAMPEP_0113547346 /NCGR_PEP_ID=MMETSP0015_2-20120614/12304_1 /TAXON_ID=2838 /ORGANISM="Odontella" /LENGTH=313 /DNA_ID=CAMNT_0000447889 /DNA_START=71 /DNA_END=1012 /DNA_ORIENTATION=- /assembly_acc=CAM_ASM_000160